MTVEELIKQLKTKDPKAVVILPLIGRNYGYWGPLDEIGVCYFKNRMSNQPSGKSAVTLLS